jgi:8-oxo-dGTP diphosphatase
MQQKPANFCYPYPHPAVTTDTVLFTIRQKKLCILLIQRAAEPFRLNWALPGGFLEIDETPLACAKRELQEETGIQDIYLEQLHTFGEPARDPRERVISIAYLGLAPWNRLRPQAASDARAVAWHPIDALPDMAFDHADIAAMARQRLMEKLTCTTIVFRLMPDNFSLDDLQAAYEILLGERVEKSNPCRRLLVNNALEAIEIEAFNDHRSRTRLYRPKNQNQVVTLKY